MTRSCPIQISIHIYGGRLGQTRCIYENKYKKKRLKSASQLRRPWPPGAVQSFYPTDERQTTASESRDADGFGVGGNAEISTNKERGYIRSMPWCVCLVSVAICSATSVLPHRLCFIHNDLTDR